MKKFYLIKNMTLIQFSLKMVQINSLFVSLIKEMTLLSNRYNPSHLNPKLLFKLSSRHLQKRITKPFINNLSYLMILTLQVMTKIIFTPEFQNLTLPSYKTQHYKQKIIHPQSINSHYLTKISFCNKCTTKFTISHTLSTNHTFL